MRDFGSWFNDFGSNEDLEKEKEEIEQEKPENNLENTDKYIPMDAYFNLNNNISLSERVESVNYMLAGRRFGKCYQDNLKDIGEFKATFDFNISEDEAENLYKFAESISFKPDVAWEGAMIEQFENDSCMFEQMHAYGFPRVLVACLEKLGLSVDHFMNIYDKGFENIPPEKCYVDSEGFETYCSLDEVKCFKNWQTSIDERMFIGQFESNRLKEAEAYRLGAKLTLQTLVKGDENNGE